MNKILNANADNSTTLSFMRKDKLIYRKKTDFNITFFVSTRVCTLFTVLKNIFEMIHDVNDYFDFDRTYKLIKLT